MSTVQSVERAFSVLRALAGGPAGVSEVAARTGLPKSTVSRLLGTLVELGAVEQSEQLGVYGLGELIITICSEPPPAATVWMAIMGARSLTPATWVSYTRSNVPS